MNSSSSLDSVDMTVHRLFIESPASIWPPLLLADCPTPLWYDLERITIEELKHKTDLYLNVNFEIGKTRIVCGIDIGRHVLKTQQTSGTINVLCGCVCIGLLLVLVWYMCDAVPFKRYLVHGNRGVFNRVSGEERCLTLRANWLLQSVNILSTHFY